MKTFGHGGLEGELGGQPWSMGLRAEDQREGERARSVGLRKRETEGERGRKKNE